MKFRIWTLVIAALVTALIGTACIAEAEEHVFAFSEWDWANEAINNFSGSVDLSGLTNQKLVFQLQAFFSPASQAASEIEPKFTHFNGNRLTMLEQSSQITCIPEENATTLSFEASVQMPEKEHYQKLTVQLSIFDENGNKLAEKTADIVRNDRRQEQNGEIFYIPFEIKTVSGVIAAAAVIIWCLAITRNRIIHHQSMTGDHSHADL